MADTKLSALTLGTLPEYTYGIQGSVGKRYHGNNTVNVKDHGALGNGVADDRAAIQAVIDAYTTNGANQHLNKNIYFPAGNYPIAGPLRFTDVLEVDVFGDGFQHSFITAHPSYPRNGNTFATNTSVSCLFELDGFHNSKIRDLSLYWGSGVFTPYNTACIYAYGGNHRSDTVDIDNVYFTGASYGVLIGGGPLVSEWCYRRAKFVGNGQAAVIIFGQNSLNHTFYGCSFDANGNAPIITTCTGSITGTVLNVTTFTPGGTNLQPLIAGLLIFDATGTIRGNTVITETNLENAARTGTGGTGTYTVSQSHTATGPLSISALNQNNSQIVNVSGAATIISGCDFTNSNTDIMDTGANNIVVSGIRTESPNFAIIGGGTAASLNGCYIAPNLISDFTATTTGPLLNVSAITAGPGLVPGMYVYGSDGTTSLPETGLFPAVTKIVLQLTNTDVAWGRTGVYLLNQSPINNMTTFAGHGRPVFLDMQGGSAASLNECGATGGVITGSNNSQVRIRNNRFGPGGFITTDLLRGFHGRVLEYDVAAQVGVGNETFANLPTAHARFKGCRMYIIDSTVAVSTSNFGATVAGGGGFTVPVWCDGINWRIG